MGDAEIILGRRLGLRITDLTALGHLIFDGDPLTPSGLSARMGMSPPAVTELVDRLERAGYVVRVRADRDRRRIHLLPTAAALSEVHRELAPLLTAVDEVVRRYPAADRAVIGRFLDDVVAVYGCPPAPVGPRPDL